jgi:hypothetical protein
MSAIDNKWLKVLPSVVLTPTIEPVIIALEPFFEKANHVAYVTSGFRDGVNQLGVIRKYLVAKGLDTKYPEAMTCKVSDFSGFNYVWQMAWSNLLAVGVIINPPLSARCLMHTTFDKRDRFKALINQTPHARGTAFDIGGSENGISDEAVIIQKALQAKVPGLLDFLAEHENNAVHCDCAKIG